MSKQLEDMAAQVADEQGALDGGDETTRERVLRMGSNLRQMQKLQKAEQAETGQTWKEWCAEEKERRAFFPGAQQVRAYSLISRFPGAYEKGMSIKEAYKQAGKWKKNNGKRPPKVKVEMKRELVQLQSACGRAERKIEKLNEVSDLVSYADLEKWDEDELAGAKEGLVLLRNETTLLLKKMNEIEFHEVH